jgi:hypothetical protein
MVTQPAVYEALLAGRIDLPKAKMIIDEVDLMEREQATAVIDQIMRDAEIYTLPRLREQIRRLVITIDLELVHKRYRTMTPAITSTVVTCHPCPGSA